MKVTIIGSKVFDSLEYHIADSFRELGHDVFHIDMADIVPAKYLYNYWLSKFIPKYGDTIFGKIITRVIGNGADLIVCTYRFIPIAIIEELKRKLPNVPIVQLNPDALTTFEKQQVFASPYDFYFTKDPYICDFMKNKAGLNTFYMPEAFNSRVHKPLIADRVELERKVNVDVLVFGSLYPYRINLVKSLLKANINVTLYGNKQFKDKDLDGRFRNEWITGDRKSEVLTGSKIIFNNFHYAEIQSVNCKFFEIAGCGGFQICDYKTAIAEYSIIEAEKFTFKNIDEAIDKIKFYLTNPDLRYAIADKQREHFLVSHTYDIRVQQMLDIIFK